MEEVDVILDNLLRKSLHEFPNIVDVKVLCPLPDGPARLAVIPVCDRSKPPHLFVIYDDNGEIVIDDC